MLVKRDVVRLASAHLVVFNKKLCSVLICVLVSTICLSSVDSPSISLGDQARVTEGVLNEKSFVLVFRVTSSFEMI